MSYKGKSTTRSWATLPPEIVRLVITHYLLDVSATSFLPAVWAQREHWPGRMVFAVVRDADAIERLMQVSPAWSAALEYHLFWQQAAAVLDPNDHLLPFTRQQRLSPFRHFRHNVYQRACVPCRINHPIHSQGLLAAKRQVFTYSLNYIPCCKEHRKERFCGVCLRDASLDENCIAENEDTEAWPQIDATCRECRAEWLWRVASENEKQVDSDLSKEAEAVGGKGFAADDWEARQAVDTFIEIGEGTMRDVILLCMEKLWLRKNTKIVEMMQLAVATTRLQSRMAANASEAGVGGGGGFGGMGGMGEIYESEEELSEVDEDDDDPELMSITEDTQGVRELAINDWARTRILDGHWYSPADQWYLLQGQSQSGSSPTSPTSPTSSTYPFPYIPAQHPVAWSLSPDVAEQAHPDPVAVREHPPPSLALCSAAFDAYRRQLRMLLLPAMINIVRKVVMECAVDGVDACVRIARMDIDDVMEVLRDSGMWYNGMDWMGRRRNENEKKDDSDDSSISSKSGSQTTSPVLSTSTLQTTPSPPPATDDKIKTSSDDSTPTLENVASRSRLRPPPSITTFPIAISPVLESPTQIPSIPFIPESLSEMPPYTMETLKQIWRDATAPLFQCRCSICERAVLKANIEAGNIVPSQYHQKQEQPQVQSEVAETQAQLVEVRLDPASDEDEELMLPSSDIDSEQEQLWKTVGEKRPCEALGLVDGECASTEGGDRDQKHRSPSPPKRARLGDHEIDGTPMQTPGAVRLQKRGSEEVEHVDELSSERGLSSEDSTHVQAKRARTSASPRALPSIESASDALRRMAGAPAALPQVKSAVYAMSDLRGGAIGGSIEDADLDEDGLYVMDDVSSDLDETERNWGGGYISTV